MGGTVSGRSNCTVVKGLVVIMAPFLPFILVAAVAYPTSLIVGVILMYFCSKTIKPKDAEHANE